MKPELMHIPKPAGTVADILEAKGTEVHAIAPRETVYDAIVKMSEMRVGALLVMEGPTLVGVVSERDYTRRVILLGRASKDTPVADIMTAEVITVTPETSLGECLHIVTRHNIRHLPVLSGGEVVGVVSIGDLVSAVVAQQVETIASLKSFIGSDYPN
ncbi:MAG: CBS domain-containing protein [Rubrivivax sp.]|nr:CBS domain-containing protein [Rubrivivax sp.]